MLRVAGVALQELLASGAGVVPKASLPEPEVVVVVVAAA